MLHPHPLELLASRLRPGSRVLTAKTLDGGVSAEVVALELEDDDGRATFVVRAHGPRDRERDRDLQVHEFELLQVLQASGIPVPAPRHVEPGWCVVVDFVEGESGVTAADPEGLADVLAQIHDVPPPSFLRGEGVLLHGDFWPGNTLWRDGRLVAVIDWEDAAVGHPLSDVGNARLELLWSHGAEAMDAFTDAYARRTGVDLAELPAWDIRADRRLTPRISEWGLDPAEERRLLAARYTFLEHAFARLPDLQG